MPTDSEPPKLSSRDLGVMLSGLARRVDATCLECSNKIERCTVRRAFCRPACKIKHWRRRVRDLGPYEETPPAVPEIEAVH